MMKKSKAHLVFSHLGISYQSQFKRTDQLLGQSIMISPDAMSEVGV